MTMPAGNQAGLIGSSVGADEWRDTILGVADPAQAWNAIFDRLAHIALSSTGADALHKETIIPDRLLAEAAWNLWEEFPRCAATVIDGLKHFWVAATSSGTAVLILDGLSLRELPLIIAGASERGLAPVRVEVRGAEVPTETDRFAEALGLGSRSKLYNNQPPATFVFAGPDVHTDVLDAPFVDCVNLIPPRPRLFIWHKWPDEPLIHLHQNESGGPRIVAERTREQLSSDGFWTFVDRLRQGRRLVITADHGYAVSKLFSSEITDQDSINLLRETFGAKRCAQERPDRPWQRRHLPPLVCRHGGWLVVMGQRKWKVQGGFPHLCHRGLSLLEAAVPFIEFPPR